MIRNVVRPTALRFSLRPMCKRPCASLVTSQPIAVRNETWRHWPTGVGGAHMMISRSMVTRIQLTPLIMKFVPGESVAETDTAKAFYNLEEARRLSLATQIHNIEGLKSRTEAWQVLVPKIITTITNFFASKQPILLKPSAIDTARSFD
ncbi:hypothetical protein EMCRGX_G032025 [Ephydatia muelleri]